MKPENLLINSQTWTLFPQLWNKDSGYHSPLFAWALDKLVLDAAIINGVGLIWCSFLFSSCDSAFIWTLTQIYQDLTCILAHIQETFRRDAVSITTICWLSWRFRKRPGMKGTAKWWGGAVIGVQSKKEVKACKQLEGSGIFSRGEKGWGQEQSRN